MRSMQKKKTLIHVWHLEMTTPSLPEASRRPYDLHRVEKPQPELSRFLYTSVGAPWKWYQRLGWNWQKWQDHLTRPGVETWIACQGAVPVGYFELNREADGSTEIAYFGLVPEFVGLGLGKSLLEDALISAWQGTRKRVWLHTCTLDHPSALTNYLARGFSIFKEEDIEEMIPASPLEPWPNAGKKPGKETGKT